MGALPDGSPQHEQAYREYVEAMRHHRNLDDGFWVASVDPIAAEQAQTGTVPASQFRTAALFSEGASRLVALFGLATWQQALDMLEHPGPAELIRRVREAQQSDLNGTRWPHGKPYDDATAVYLIVNIDAE